MRLITIDQARAQVHADGVDDAMLTTYGNGAERHAEQFLNRKLYADESELSAALAGVSASIEAAETAYEAAMEAAAELTGEARCAAERAAYRNRSAAFVDAEETSRGMVVNEDIRGGILLILATLYRDREKAEIPSGAYTLLWPYRVGLGV